MDETATRRPTRRGLVLAASLTLVAGILAVARVPMGVEPATASPASRSFVESAAADLLGRPPSEPEADRWEAELDAGRPRIALTTELARSAGWAAQIVGVHYEGALGREPEPRGLAHWTARLTGGDSPRRVAAELYGSAERYHRSGSDARAYVAELYRSVLGRGPDAAGLAHWTDALTETPRVNVALAFLSTFEASGRRVDQLYARLLDRNPDPSGRTFWAARLAAGDERDLAAALVASDEYLRAVPAPSPGTTTTSETAPPTTAPTPTAEHFTGTVEDFYVVPQPMKVAAPGTLIRYQEIGEAGGRATLRIMYHSRDAEGRDRATTGIVTYPVGVDAPAGGWPVVSSAHGTTGIAEMCAPSRRSGQAPAYGVQGVAVATDYIGLGPVGEVHSYLNGVSEGNAMIDAVRAARTIPAARAGNRWFSIGGSQGGHAALFGGERSATYAPELELLGTVAMAPPAAFDQTFGPVDEIVVRIIGVMMIYGAVIEHPSIDPARYASDPVAAASDVLFDDCLGRIQDVYIPLAAQGPAFWKVDPRTVEPTRSFTLAQEPGLVTTDAPMYVSSGTSDIQVNYQRERILVERLCGLGQVVEFHEFAGADHGAVFALSDARVREWLAERLAGDPPVDSCDDPGRPRPTP